MDGAGNRGNFSSPASFTISLLLSPSNGTNTSQQPTLSWVAYPGATRYQIQISTTSTFSTVTRQVESPASAPTSLVVPTPLAAGLYYWRVNVDTGSGFVLSPVATSFVVVLTPTPVTPTTPPPTTPPNDRPVLRSPGPDATIADTSPQLEWEVVAGAGSYEVQVTRYMPFGRNLAFQTTTSLTSVVTSELREGSYYWRVRAIGSDGRRKPWSQIRRLTIDATPLSMVELRSPQDGIVTTNSQPALRWYALAEVAIYQVIVDTDRACDAEPLATTARRSFRFESPLAQGTYYWCVRGVDAAGNPGPLSEVWSFTVNILRAPANGAVFTTRRGSASPRLSWESVSGVAGYTLQIDDAADFSSPIEVHVDSAASYQVNPALPYGSYYWRVIPDGFETSSVAVRQFIIRPPP